MAMLLTERCPRWLEYCQCERCLIWDQMRAPLTMEGQLGVTGLICAIYAWQRYCLVQAMIEASITAFMRTQGL